jgi:phage head maturation protease
VSAARDYLATPDLGTPGCIRRTDELAGLILRDDGSERIVEGQVVPFNTWIEVDNPREGHFVERFAPGSLRKSLGLLQRVKGYFEHGRSRMFERAPIMQIQDTWEQADGAYFRASLLRGLPAWIEDGLRRGLYGASLGAEPIVVERERYPRPSTYNPKGLEERTYREIRAYDISLTARPAYESAVVALRSHEWIPYAPRRDYLRDVDYFADPLPDLL